MKNIIMVVALVATQFVAASKQDWFAAIPTPIEKAHEAYLNNNLLKMTSNIKEVLMTESIDSVSAQNALELLKKTQVDLGKKALPVDWKLPEAVERMKVSIIRRARQGGSYKLKVSGATQFPKMITQLQVTRYPDNVVLDKSVGIGEWYESQKPGEENYFELATSRTKQQVPAGLYLINLSLTNGDSVKGWVVLTSDLNSTDSPKIDTPYFGQKFETPRPYFEWQNFQSPQYQPHERRGIYIGVTPMEPPHYHWKSLWGKYFSDADTQSVQVGTDLNPGRYLVFLTYQEKQRWGDITISRSSSNGRIFYIQ